MEICKHQKAFGFEAYVHVALAVVFIFLPDLIYDFLLKIYNLLNNDDDEDQAKAKGTDSTDIVESI